MQAPSDWTARLLGAQPPRFGSTSTSAPYDYDPSAAVHPEAFIRALVWLLQPSNGVTSLIQPAAASALAMLLRDAGDAVAGPALDTGVCDLLVRALRDSSRITFSTGNNTWTASLREEAAEALHGLVALQSPAGYGSFTTLAPPWPSRSLWEHDAEHGTHCATTVAELTRPSVSSLHMAAVGNRLSNGQPTQAASVIVTQATLGYLSRHSSRNQAGIVTCHQAIESCSSHPLLSACSHNLVRSRAYPLVAHARIFLFLPFLGLTGWRDTCAGRGQSRLLSI